MSVKNREEFYEKASSEVGHSRSRRKIEEEPEMSEAERMGYRPQEDARSNLRFNRS